jgi:hypothetical protein
VTYDIGALHGFDLVVHEGLDRACGVEVPRLVRESPQERSGLEGILPEAVNWWPRQHTKSGRCTHVCIGTCNAQLGVLAPYVGSLQLDDELLKEIGPNDHATKDQLALMLAYLTIYDMCLGPAAQDYNDLQLEDRLAGKAQHRSAFQPRW